MNDFDSEVYEKYMAEIGTEVSSLRVVLEGVEAKAKERLWLTHQTTGDFDDRKIVEGITGEKNIFKRRGLQDPTPGAPQEKPKRIRFVLVSMHHLDLRLIVCRILVVVCIGSILKTKDLRDCCSQR